MAGPVKHTPWKNPWSPNHVVGKPASSGKPASPSSKPARKGGSRRGKPSGS